MEIIALYIHQFGEQIFDSRPTCAATSAVLPPNSHVIAAHPIQGSNETIDHVAPSNPAATSDRLGSPLCPMTRHQPKNGKPVRPDQSTGATSPLHLATRFDLNEYRGHTSTSCLKRPVEIPFARPRPAPVHPRCRPTCPSTVFAVGASPPRSSRRHPRQQPQNN